MSHHQQRKGAYTINRFSIAVVGLLFSAILMVVLIAGISGIEKQAIQILLNS